MNVVTVTLTASRRVLLRTVKEAAGTAVAINYVTTAQFYIISNSLFVQGFYIVESYNVMNVIPRNHSSEEIRPSCVHKMPQLVPVLSQLYPVHAVILNLFNIRFNNYWISYSVVQ